MPVAHELHAPVVKMFKPGILNTENGDWNGFQGLVDWYQYFGLWDGGKKNQK